jgi:dTDP-glucose pyrophosphorylase
VTIELQKTTIAEGSTLLEALRAIEENGIEIVFVVDEDRRVLGTLSDGDIRRALLVGRPLESRCIPEAMRRDFTYVDSRAGRAEVLDIMRARSFDQVPVLDAARRLVGLHLLHELLGMITRPNWAVIMAGGRGTRLGLLTENIPKPMLPVAGRPILERLVLHLVGFGIREVYLSVNYLSHVIEDHFGDGEGFGCRIHYLHEEQPLGTGGSLSLLPGVPEDPILVMNGDLVTDVDVGSLLTTHSQGGFAATVCVRPHRLEWPYGVVQLESGNVVALEEKPNEHRLINAGIYALEGRLVKEVPRNCTFPITDLIHQCLTQKDPVGAYMDDGEWIDVGRHDELKQARGNQ